MIKKNERIQIIEKWKWIISFCIIIIMTISPILNIVQAEETNKEQEETEVDNDEIFIDVKTCVEIAGSKEDGYYIKFVDDIDEKLQKIYNENIKEYKRLGVSDISTFKKMLKAQVATEYPSMGGIVESSTPISSGTEAPAGGNTSGGGGSTSSGTGSTTIKISPGDITWPQEKVDLTLLGDEDFGPRVLSGGTTPHDGLDFNNSEDLAACLSIADGEVVAAGFSETGYGYAVKVWHEKIKLYSFYGHMSDNIPVSVGQIIKKGTVVGYESGSGSGRNLRDYDLHLHFGLHSAADDERGGYLDKSSGVDPLEVFVKAGIIKVVSAPESSLYSSDEYVLELGDNAPTQDATIDVSGAGGSSSSGSGSTSGAGQASDNQNANITIKENKSINGDENRFQGAVKLRRLTPNKPIGEYTEELMREPELIEKGDFEGMGKAEEVPIAIQNQIKKASLANNKTIKFDDLAYLTIPYIDQYENMKTGHMIVNKLIADDVISIFYRLLGIKYPINRINIVDTFFDKYVAPILKADKDKEKEEEKKKEENKDGDKTETKEEAKTEAKEENKEEAKAEDKTETKEETKEDENIKKVDNKDNLGKASADNNNTSSLYYNINEATNSHMTGNAIDLNPMINPKVKDGKTDQYNAQQYVDRTKKGEWTEGDQRAFIDKESEVYKIFEEYGWTWGGDNGDYGHFEKKEIKEESIKEESIESKYYDLSYVTEQVFNSYVKTGDKRALYVYTLNANNEIIVASWTYKTEEGFKIVKSKPINHRGALSKYSMPFEYLSTMLTQTADVSFVEGLAALAATSEYIITIEDTVSTTKIEEVTTQQTIETNAEGEVVSTGSAETTTNTKHTESVSQKPAVTYINNWYIQYEKEFKGSTKSLTNTTDGLIKEQIIKVNGTKKSTPSYGTPVPTETVHEKENESDNTKTTITTTVVNKGTVVYEYNTGQGEVALNAKHFIKLYWASSIAVKNNMYMLWLIDALERYTKTANLVDVTRYLFYQADKKNFEMAVIRTEDYKPDDFKSISGSNANGSLNIVGGTTEEKVWNALKSAGYSETAAAAAMGNIYGESGFDPAVIEGGNAIGFGLCQWSFGRRSQIEAFAASRGKSPSDVDLQIEFLLAELTVGGGADGYADYQFSGHETNRSIWMTSNDIAEATTAFCAGFERPSIPHNETRIAAAQDYYNQYHK